MVKKILLVIILLGFGVFAGINGKISFYSEIIIGIILGIFICNEVIIRLNIKRAKISEDYLERIKNKEEVLELRLISIHDPYSKLIYKIGEDLNNIYKKLEGDELNIILKEKLINKLDIGIVETDLEYHIIYANNYFGKLFDLSNVSENYSNLIVKNPDIKELYKRVHETKEKVEVEYKGIFLTLEEVLTEEKDKILFLYKDITAFRKFRELRKEFVSNVTHELKTPLTSIRGFIDTLKNNENFTDEEKKKCLDIIDVESKRLEGLVEDILVVSKIEEGRMDSSEKRYNIKKLFQEIIESNRVKIEQKNIKVSFDISNDLEMDINSNVFKLLFTNIVTNGINYNVDSGTLQIKCLEMDFYYKFEILDSGIGIPENEQGRVFERFYKVDKSRGVMESTGLGLSIVKQLVLSLGGKIQIESQVGKGTKFICFLPKK